MRLSTTSNERKSNHTSAAGLVRTACAIDNIPINIINQHHRGMSIADVMIEKQMRLQYEDRLSNKLKRGFIKTKNATKKSLSRFFSECWSGIRCMTKRNNSVPCLRPRIERMDLEAYDPPNSEPSRTGSDPSIRGRHLAWQKLDLDDAAMALLGLCHNCARSNSTSEAADVSSVASSETLCDCDPEESEKLEETYEEGGVHAGESQRQDSESVGGRPVPLMMNNGKTPAWWTLY